MLSYDMSDCGGQPKYIYLYQRIRDDIISGVIGQGERLPSKRLLAQHLNIGVITVSNAYDLLVTEGYLVSQERKGYFVQELPQDFIQSPTEPAPAAEEPLVKSERRPFADFRANRISMRLFPTTTWNQLMRKTISQGSELFATVPYNGLYVLRRAIADYLRSSRGMQLDPSQVIIGAGTEYLYNRLTQLFGRSAVFGFEDPGYKKLASISSAFGNLSRFIPIDQDGLRVDALEESDTDIVHISPSNHFPTGIVMPVARRAELLGWAYRASKRYIIEDDYDSEFRYQGKYIPPLYVEDGRNRVIYMNTFSKTMVPSLRISFMVLPPKLLQRYRESMSFYSCTVSSFEQYTLAQFISQGYFERHINRIKTYYRKLRLQVLQEVANSALGRISEIIERNAGTHFLLQVRTALSVEEIRQAGAQADMQLLFYSDYAHIPHEKNEKLLVINYAAIEPGEVSEVVARLEGIFPECRQAP